MSRALVIPIAAGVMLLACKHSEKTELSASGHTEAVRLETSQSDTVTTRTEGPERITTTVEEFSVDHVPAPVGGAVAAGAGDGIKIAQDGPPPAGGADGSNERRDQNQHGALLRRTVTVAERGPVLTESHATALGASQSAAKSESVSKAVHEKKSAPAGCGFAGSLLAWAVPLVLLALAWKFRALIPWWPK